MLNVYNLPKINEIVIVLPKNGKAQNVICHVLIHL
jgi:hypothetical protein